MNNFKTHNRLIKTIIFSLVFTLFFSYIPISGVVKAENLDNEITQSEDSEITDDQGDPEILDVPVEIPEEILEEDNDGDTVDETPDTNIDEEIDLGEIPTDLDEEEKEKFIEEIPEKYPEMLGEPQLIFPNTLSRMKRTASISDTIGVNKTATRCLGECRTFEVTLNITGTPQEAPVDVVLVIDRSGSMSDGNVTEYVAIESAPSTNKSYYVKIDGTYQSVSYSSGGWYSPPQGWYYGSGSSRRYVTWDASGDDNAAGGSSNTPVAKPFYESFGRSRMYLAKQAALNFAAKVLGPDGVAGSRVSIVSYAGPTTSSGSGSYGIQGHAKTDQDLTSDISLVNDAIAKLSANGGTNTEAGFIQAKNVIEDEISNENPNSSKVVVMFTDGMPTSSIGNAYGPNDPTGHNNHTIAAYTAGQDIYNNGIADVFTVGLFEGMTGAVYNLAVNTLTRAQNKGFYDAPTAAALGGIFNDISTQLGYAATQAAVVDKIGDNFELVPGTLTAGSYNETTREISWNPGTIYNSAQLKYKVVAKETFDGGLADTNEYATLTYKDIFGIAGKTKTFPIPNVNVPTKIEMFLENATIIRGQTINLGEGTDPLGDNYMSPVTGGDHDGENFTYEWRVVGNSNVISTDKNPNVKPSVDTQYEVRVTDSNGCIAVALMTVFVTEPLVNITANKVWVGGPTVKPTINLQLYRNIDGGAKEAVESPVQLINGVTSKTWNNLPKLDANAVEFVYTVQEVAVPVNYTKAESGLTVTNTYVSPKIDVTGTKAWINGPGVKPTIQIELYRNNVKVGGPVTLVNGTTTYTWTGMDKTDNNGVDYIYTIKEIGTPATYIKEEIGLKVTNTYVSPKIDITGTKVWVNGSEDRPNIQLELYQNNIKVGGPVTLVNGTETYTWVGQNKTDNNGVNYTYTVKEVGVPLNYTKAESGLTVTNTYVSPKIDVIGTKTWVNGPEVKPDIQIELYRNGVKLAGPVTLLRGTTSYTWPGLDKTDSSGVDYTYTVKEVIVPDNYTNVEDGLSITNTYVSPKIEITAIKQWVGGTQPVNKVKFQLYRTVGNALSLVVGEPVQLLENTYTWTDLDKTDINGNEYIYSFIESSVPEYYEVTYSTEGLIAINTIKTGKLDIAKNVSGNFGDKSKVFTISVKFISPTGLVDSIIKYTDPLGNVSEYTLKNDPSEKIIEIELIDGQTGIFNEIPYGVSYVVEELNAEGYVIDINNGTGNIIKEDTSVIVTNNINAEIDTGILLDFAPYIFILALVATGGLWLFIRKRKQNDFNQGRDIY